MREIFESYTWLRIRTRWYKFRGWLEGDYRECGSFFGRSHISSPYAQGGPAAERDPKLACETHID